MLDVLLAPMKAWRRHATALGRLFPSREKQNHSATFLGFILTTGGNLISTLNDNTRQEKRFLLIGMEFRELIVMGDHPNLFFLCPE